MRTILMSRDNIMDKIKKLKYMEWIGILLLGITMILAAVSIRFCFSSDIWYDELFTMGLTGHSFQDMIGYTARDVHPPFYYIYVKVIRDILALFGIATGTCSYSK